jgi:hypothetical protein
MTLYVDVVIPFACREAFYVLQVCLVSGDGIILPPSNDATDMNVERACFHACPHHTCTRLPRRSHESEKPWRAPRPETAGTHHHHTQCGNTGKAFEDGAFGLPWPVATNRSGQSEGFLGTRSRGPGVAVVSRHQYGYMIETSQHGCA